MDNRKCRCEEGIRHPVGKDPVTGERLAEVRAPPVHDCVYVAERNMLIPRAEQFARMIAGPEPAGGKRPDWVIRWNTAFCEEMGRLWAAEKQRSS